MTEPRSVQKADSHQFKYPMKRSSLSALVVVVAGACFLSASAGSIVSVSAVNSDAHAFNSGVGTFKTGDTLTVARNATTIYAPDPYTVPALGISTTAAPVWAFTDRNHVWVGFGAAQGGAPNPVNFPSYLLGLEYVITLNGNRDNVAPPFRIDVTTSGPGIAYLFIDNRLGDDNALNPPQPSLVTGGAAQWILDDGWTLVNTGLKPADYTGNNDILGIDEGNDGGINQYMSIYSKAITGNSFTLKTYGESRDMYGVAFAPIPEPGWLALFSVGALLMTLRRRR